MEQWKAEYLKAIESWDKTHRLVGRMSVEALLDESIEAIAAALAQGYLETGDVLVDVGAGQGLMGYPWLYAGPQAKLITVEPDRKKTAFLLWFRSSLPKNVSERWLHFPKSIQNVSCETLESAFSAKEHGLRPRVACVARAFSGSDSLASAIRHIGCPIYTFEKKSGRSCLEPLES